MGSDICMDVSQLSAFLNNKCSLTNTNRELIYGWFVQQRRTREPERLTEDHDSSNESEAESEVDIPGLPKDGDEAEDGSCEEKEDEGEEEEEEDDLPKTPLPSRSSSRTPKPRQLDLPDLSPTRKRKRSSTSTRRQYPSSRSSVGDDTVSEEGLSTLKPMDVVWAKCAGYPTYPAMIVDPSTAPGYTHHGIPIPSPPSEVLQQQPDKGHSFLVLFFDIRRTWQWLPHRKLQQLGVDTELDNAKLAEGKKGSGKKGIAEAFKRAQVHLKVVNGQSSKQDKEEEETPAESDTMETEEETAEPEQN
eukprot:sb/3467281/